MGFKTEMVISTAAAREICKLVIEHTKEGGPYNNKLLLEASDALSWADRIVITKEGPPSAD